MSKTKSSTPSIDLGHRSHANYDAAMGRAAEEASASPDDWEAGYIAALWKRDLKLAAIGTFQFSPGEYPDGLPFVAPHPSPGSVIKWDPDTHIIWR